MRAIFGVLSLLLVLWLVVSLVIGLLTVPKPASGPSPSPLTSGQTPQQVQQAFKVTLVRAIQQPRPEAAGAQGAAAEVEP